MPVPRVALAVAITVSISACKLEISTPAEGSVDSESGSYSCGANQICDIDVSDIFFDETFVAIPKTGYEFEGWKKDDSHFCGGSKNPCRIYTSFFEGNAVLMSLLESDEVWHLEPKFKKPNTWRNRASMPSPHAEFSSCAVDGRIYAFGGRKGLTESAPEFTTAVEEYDPENNKWRSRKNTPSQRKHTTATALGDKCYVSGGQSSPFGTAGPAVPTLTSYNPSTNNWSMLKDMPTARFSAASATVDGKLYVIGGYDDAGATGIVEMYDPATNTWASRASMPTARGSPGAAVINGKIYVAGGTESIYTSNYETLERYDPATNTWKTLAPMPGPKLTFQLVASGNRLYALGGLSGYWIYDTSTYSYNPKTDTWKTLAPIPSQRWGFAAEAVNGRVYAFGGVPAYGDPASTSTVEYTP